MAITNNFNRILVGLDISETDLSLIKYVSWLSKKIKPSHIYFIHVEKNLESYEMASQLGHEDKKAFVPLDEKREKQMRTEVNNYFSKSENIQIDFEIVEGEPLHEILHWAMIKKADLIILGKKTKEKGIGLITERLARKAPCSLMIIPEDSKEQLKQIHIPIDFSEHSNISVKTGIALATHSTSEQITCQHIYNVPLGYYKTGKTFEEVAEIMKENAKKKFETFITNIDKNNIPVVCEFTLEAEKDTVDCIIDFSKSIQSDLLIIGSKGRTNTSVMLLGSLAEKILKRGFSCPLLIVKKPGENLGFLKALLSL